jgi:hypothetical protein
MSVRKLIRAALLLVLLACAGRAGAQLPVEAFGGDKKATFDALFFRFFRKVNDEQSRFLFFSRTRALVDYKMTTTTNLPEFGLTEAFSYNAPKLKGVAPVAVVQMLNRGVFPKAGVQYVLLRKKVTLFTWLVSELDHDPVIDHFLLLRFTPRLSEKFLLFLQAESISAFPTQSTTNVSLVQRFRLGLSRGAYQLGAGVDLTETGRDRFTGTQNTGLFLRWDFR